MLPTCFPTPLPYIFKVPVGGGSLTVESTCGINVDIFKVPVAGVSLTVLQSRVYAGLNLNLFKVPMGGGSLTVACTCVRTHREPI